MKTILKTIHFEMFENNNEHKRLMSNHFLDTGRCVRNDQAITGCREAANLLKRLEEAVLSKLTG